MNEQLKDLLERAKAVVITPEEQMQQRVHAAAANGHLADERITVKTVEAARTIMVAAQQQPGATSL